jgi:hypothetical protein
MLKKFLLLSLCIALLFSGCQAGAILSTRMPSPNAITNPTNTLPHPPIQRITEAITSPTIEVTPDAPEPTLTATFPADTHLSLQCLEVTETLPTGFSSLGTVIFQSRDTKPTPHVDLFLHDMIDNSVSTVTMNDFDHVGSVVSPDKTQIAYIRVPADDDGNPTMDKELVVATLDDTRLSTIPWENDWKTIEGWTSDQRLVIHALLSDSSGGDDINQKSYYLVVNPLTGEREELFHDFPGYFNPQLAQGTGDWWGVSYSPDLTRAVYLRYLPDDTELFTYSIWDLEKQQLLATLVEVYSYYTLFGTMANRPVWSPDGSSFAIIGLNMDPPGEVEYSEYELYRVSKDGPVEQLTNLSPVAVLQGLRFSWSPDSQKIALYLDTWYDTKNSHVALLDMETLEVIDYCISLPGGYHVEPIWAPDSKQFIAYSQDETDQTSQSILVDITGGFAAQIATDMSILGWMVAP